MRIALEGPKYRRTASSLIKTGGTSRNKRRPLGGQPMRSTGQLTGCRQNGIIGVGNLERGRDHGMQAVIWDRAGHVPQVQRHPAEQNRPMFGGDVQDGWGGLALLALRKRGWRVF
jgi:hypothetical protein